MAGAASGGGKLHESWEFDSGARDLSPEPHTLQKLVEAAGGSLLTSGATGNMLDLANKVRWLHHVYCYHVTGLRTKTLSYELWIYHRLYSVQSFSPSTFLRFPMSGLFPGQP
jgi:hypothetical protein